MKATLTFTIPEESNDFEIASKAIDYALAWNELKNYLRSKRKYETLTEDEFNIIIDIIEQINNIEVEYLLPLLK